MVKRGLVWGIVGVLAVTINAQAAFVVSDSFTRSDDPVTLGATEAGGLTWGVRVLGTDGRTADGPGIKNGALYFLGGSSQDAAYLDFGIKDFTMEFDYTKTGGSHYGMVHFLMAAPSNMLTDGGINQGYMLLLKPLAGGDLQLDLYSEYPDYNVRATATVQTGCSTSVASHIKLESSGNTIKIYADDTAGNSQLAINFTDTTANPAVTTPGHFTFSNANWTASAYDNIVITPEPVTMAMVLCGGIVGLIRRR